MPGGLNILRIKLMPESPSADLNKMKADAESTVKKVGGIFNGSIEEPIAFGLNALIITAGLKEDRSPELLETELAKIEHVQSVEVIDVRRAFG